MARPRLHRHQCGTSSLQNRCVKLPFPVAVHLWSTPHTAPSWQQVMRHVPVSRRLFSAWHHVEAFSRGGHSSNFFRHSSCCGGVGVYVKMVHLALYSLVPPPHPSSCAAPGSPAAPTSTAPISRQTIHPGQTAPPDCPPPPAVGLPTPARRRRAHRAPQRPSGSAKLSAKSTVHMRSPDPAGRVTSKRGYESAWVGRESPTRPTVATHRCRHIAARAAPP